MSTQRPAAHPPARAPRHPRWGDWYVPALTLALLCVAIALLLAVTPLWETADTYCERIITHPSGGGAPECHSVANRRKEWIAVVLGIGLLLVALAVILRRIRVKRIPTGRRWVVLGLMVAAIGFGTTAGAYLTYGHGHDLCGSTLSRYDPNGEYFEGTPAGCAPSYAASRLDATIFGWLAFAAFALGTATQVTHQAANAPGYERPADR